MKKQYKIALISGDGIGKEVLKEGVKILNTVAELDGTFEFKYTNFPWGCEYYLDQGKIMDENGLEQLRAFDAIFFGAVGNPKVPDHLSLWDLLLAIRKGFNQYINLRPIKLLDEKLCPLKGVRKDQIDMLVIRENSEGEYAGEGSWLFKGQPEEVVLQTGVFSRKGTERVIRYAFEEAKKQGKSLTSISKGNALNYSMVFWDQVFEEVSKEYPEVKTYSYLVDAAALFFVREPWRFEIIVTSNLFGDILTDLGAAITGGLGLAAGANVNPVREFPSMFEPIHGSAPDIAGLGIANPLATIWSASQMLAHFEQHDWAEKVLYAVQEIISEGKTLTTDLGGQAKTEEVGDAVVGKLRLLCKDYNGQKIIK
jgi:tartrate dehydrogenase/decarboxylase / D-malate dehydrogenase